jgi:hypothetical protein
VVEGEDRFGDLGPERRSAAERLEERDRTHPEPDEGPPETPRPGSRYAWLVGILMLVGLAVLLLTTALPNKGEGVLGPKQGEKLPDFAAPLVGSRLEGDANIRQRRSGSSAQGKIPACAVTSSQVLNICELRRHPVVLTFIFDRAANCNPQVDRVQKVKADFPRLRFPVVYFSHKKRDELRSVVQRRGWSMPVGLDRDGQISNLYGVGVCPTTVFALRGGKVVSTNLGELNESQLRARVRRLLRRQRATDRRARS